MFFRRRRIHSARRAREKRRSFIVYASGSFFLLFCLSAGLAWLSHWEKIIVRHVSVKGALSIPQEDVEKFASSHMAGAHVFLFPKANFFLLPRGQIKNGLREAYPQIENLEVSRGGSFSEIVVSLAERVPFMRWCGDSFSDFHSSTEKKCYYVDKAGVIFSDAEHISEEIPFELYGRVTETIVHGGDPGKNPAGFYFISPDSFTRILALKRGLEEVGLFPIALESKDGARFEFLFANGAGIIFKEGDVGLLMTNLITALETDLISKEDFSEMHSGLDYLDMRFDNRLYVKRR